MERIHTTAATTTTAFAEMLRRQSCHHNQFSHKTKIPTNIISEHIGVGQE